MIPPEISVIIPVKNGGPSFEKCLLAVRSTQGVSYQVVVVDDGSIDNTVEIASKYTTDVIKLPHSAGPANARNTGAQVANGNILFFIDSDIIIPPDTLLKIKRIFEDPGVVAITGVLSDTVCYKNFCSQYKNLWMRYTYTRLPEVVSLFYTSGAAIRREIFLESGGFDTGYRRPSVEDTAFGQKLDVMGYKVFLRTDISVEHVKYYSSFALLKTDFYRSSDLVKMTLRNGMRRFLQGNKTSVPSTTIVSITLFISTFMMIMMGFFSLFIRTYCFLLSIMTIVAIFFLNSGWLLWLRYQKGWWFSIRSLLFLFLVIPVVTLGVCFGIIDYLRGQHY